jgi:DNA polymerase III sliding clamp (beta) subunit (PCNA family)
MITLNYANIYQKLNKLQALTKRSTTLDILKYALVRVEDHPTIVASDTAPLLFNFFAPVTAPSSGSGKQLRIILASLDMDASLTLPIESLDPEDVGEFLIPLGDVAKSLATWQDSLTVSITRVPAENKIEIQGGGNKVTLASPPPDQYLTLRDRIQDNYDVIMTLPAQKFLTIFQATKTSMCLGDARPNLCAVCVMSEKDDVTFVSTDGNRLYAATLAGATVDRGGLGQVLIPEDLVTASLRCVDKDGGDVTLRWVHHQKCEITQDALYIVGRSREGAFPDFRNLLPQTKDPTNVMIELDLLIASLESAKRAGSRTKCVKVEVENESITFTTVGTKGNVIVSEGPVKVMGSVQSFMFGVNHDYILDAAKQLKTTKHDYVMITFSNKLSPILIRPVQERYQDEMAVVMPMKL